MPDSARERAILSILACCSDAQTETPATLADVLESPATASVADLCAIADVPYLTGWMLAAPSQKGRLAILPELFWARGGLPGLLLSSTADSLLACANESRNFPATVAKIFAANVTHAIIPFGLSTRQVLDGIVTLAAIRGLATIRAAGDANSRSSPQSNLSRSVSLLHATPPQSTQEDPVFAPHFVSLDMAASLLRLYLPFFASISGDQSRLFLTRAPLLAVSEIFDIISAFAKRYFPRTPSPSADDRGKPQPLILLSSMALSLLPSGYASFIRLCARGETFLTALASFPGLQPGTLNAEVVRVVDAHADEWRSLLMHAASTAGIAAVYTASRHGRNADWSRVVAGRLQPRDPEPPSHETLPRSAEGSPHATPSRGLEPKLPSPKPRLATFGTLGRLAAGLLSVTVSAASTVAGSASGAISQPPSAPVVPTPDFYTLAVHDGGSALAKELAETLSTLVGLIERPSGSSIAPLVSAEDVTAICRVAWRSALCALDAWSYSRCFERLVRPPGPVEAALVQRVCRTVYGQVPTAYAPPRPLPLLTAACDLLRLNYSRQRQLLRQIGASEDEEDVVLLSREFLSEAELQVVDTLTPKRARRLLMSTLSRSASSSVY
jgi:hypothetical protein